MPMSITNRVDANTYTSFDATLLLAAPAFQLCDPGLLQPSFLLKIINDSYVNVIISYDGIYGNDVILAHDEIVVSLQQQSRVPGNITLLERGFPVYVAAETVPGKTGDIYVISYYQPV